MVEVTAKRRYGIPRHGGGRDPLATSPGSFTRWGPIVASYQSSCCAALLPPNLVKD
jgi:hypothetical protein